MPQPPLLMEGGECTQTETCLLVKIYLRHHTSPSGARFYRYAIHQSDGFLFASLQQRFGLGTNPRPGRLAFLCAGLRIDRLFAAIGNSARQRLEAPPDLLLFIAGAGDI